MQPAQLAHMNGMQLLVILLAAPDLAGQNVKTWSSHELVLDCVCVIEEKNETFVTADIRKNMRSNPFCKQCYSFIKCASDTKQSSQ